MKDSSRSQKFLRGLALVPAVAVLSLAACTDNNNADVTINDRGETTTAQSAGTQGDAGIAPVPPAGSMNPPVAGTSDTDGTSDSVNTADSTGLNSNMNGTGTTTATGSSNTATSGSSTAATTGGDRGSTTAMTDDEEALDATTTAPDTRPGDMAANGSSDTAMDTGDMRDDEGEEVLGETTQADDVAMDESADQGQNSSESARSDTDGALAIGENVSVNAESAVTDGITGLGFIGSDRPVTMKDPVVPQWEDNFGMNVVVSGINWEGGAEDPLRISSAERMEAEYDEHLDTTADQVITGGANAYLESDDDQDTRVVPNDAWERSDMEPVGG